MSAAHDEGVNTAWVGCGPEEVPEGMGPWAGSPP